MGVANRAAAACGIVIVIAALVAGCQRDSTQVRFHAEGYPQRLSDWGVVIARDRKLQLNRGVVPYGLNSALFTDYASKLRTVWLPAGTAAQYAPTDAFEFPVGTIISKTFFYPKSGSAAGAVALVETTAEDLGGQDLDLDRFRLVETRLLVRRESGWVAIPYVWNAAQTDAELARAGENLRLGISNGEGQGGSFDYLVPNVNQCAGCHATDNSTRALRPIGLKARHLNRDYPYDSGAENQLAQLQRIGYLQGAPEPSAAPRAAAWTDPNASLEARARAYLDINCAHCHNPLGPADTSGLMLDAAAPADRRLGLCKPPVAAGQGTGGRRFGIVPGQPAESILVYRMQSTAPGAMMPELGRSLAHAEGVELVSQWITAWSGRCGSG